MMMFDIHDLAESISEILYILKEEGETIEITDGREVIAYLVPADKMQDSVEKDDSAAWATLKRIASELDPYWPPDVSAVDAVRDVRRDL